MVQNGLATLDVIMDGARGQPAIVMLPSLARDSEDFDEVAAGLAAEGFLVLRPQPRGMLGSTGPLDGVSLHDLAGDVAAVIRALVSGRAVVAGHAYGNWIARMTAVDHPALVRGVALVAAAEKARNPHLGAVVTRAGDTSLPEAERLDALREGFFAPGHDPRVWLTGWHPRIKPVQRGAAAAVKQSDWWHAGSAPILDLQAEHDPFKPPSARNELRADLGERVTVALIADASHALLPEQPHAVVEALSNWMRQLPP
jgi:pimeloyl-ACP methyl ester carboxylesterase